MINRHILNRNSVPIRRILFAAGLIVSGFGFSGCSTPLKTPTQFDYTPHHLSVSKKDFHLYVRDTSSLSAEFDQNDISEAKGDGGFLKALGSEDNEVVSTTSLNDMQQDERPILFIVKRPEWDAVSRLKPEGEEDVLFTLRERMYRYLLRNYPHPTRVRYAFLPDEKVMNEYRVIEVNSEVTHITKGNGLARFIIGYGLGAVTLQYEGSLTEIHPEKEFLGAFAIRQRHAAYPNGFMNGSVIMDAYCLRYAAEALVDELTISLPVALPPTGLPAVEVEENLETAGLN